MPRNGPIVIEPKPDPAAIDVERLLKNPFLVSGCNPVQPHAATQGDSWCGRCFRLKKQAGIDTGGIRNRDGRLIENFHSLLVVGYSDVERFQSDPAVHVDAELHLSRASKALGSGAEAEVVGGDLSAVDGTP